MLYNEILTCGADIMCLQEVDRLEKLLPVLADAGYSHTYAAGPGKKHGCLIAYGKDKFTKVDERVIHYDNEEIRQDGNEKARRGSSIRSTNIGFMSALRRNDTKTKGVIVATTHLFWHAKYVIGCRFRCSPLILRLCRYTYERARLVKFYCFPYLQ